ncbi:hypothetical protein [Vibrio sp. TRT 17S01]|uniref:hypothetical protein n=1 Tax=Vibrio sp. TRT 17S01 TaxID=3418505 RepID=UPI003CF3B9CF
MGNAKGKTGFEKSDIGEMMHLANCALDAGFKQIKIDASDALELCKLAYQSLEQSEEIESCPRCESNDVGASQGKAYCYCCKLQSGEHATNEDAITAWNKHAKSPELKRLRKERDDLAMALREMLIATQDIQDKELVGEFLLGVRSNYIELLSKLNSKV